MAAWQADVISTELDAQANVVIIKDFLCHAVQGMAVGMWLELATSISECSQDVNEVMRFDGNHLGPVIRLESAANSLGSARVIVSTGFFASMPVFPSS